MSEPRIEATPDMIREARRIQKRREAVYNLTPDEYDAMNESQSGLCAICQRKPDYALHVDHDHHTGQIRGLLCMECNTGIGKLGDSMHLVAAALEYLLKAEKESVTNLPRKYEVVTESNKKEREPIRRESSLDTELETAIREAKETILVRLKESGRKRGISHARSAAIRRMVHETV
jgi:hypothetical protein